MTPNKKNRFFMANYSGLFGSLIGGTFDLIGRGVQYGADKALMEKQNQYNLDMWNLQNEYNSPEQQMQRFQKAGLSPQLMYGQGSAGNAPSAPVQSVPSIDLANPISKMGNIFDAIKAFQQIKMNDELVNQQALKTFIESLSVRDMLAKLEARASLFKNTQDMKNLHVPVIQYFDDYGHGHVVDNELSYFYNKMFQSDYGTKYGQAREWHYRGNLADQGINIRDPWWGRLIFSTLDNALDAGGIIDQGDGLMMRLVRWLRKKL